jgi:metallo-beta-lactamase class B
MKPSTAITAALLVGIALAGPATSQNWPAAWTAAAEPSHIIGPIYQVGSQGIGVYLITSKDGNIVLDGGMPGYGAKVVENIRKLGFDPKKTRYLLNTHAHFDHSGGLAEIKQASGARMVSSAGDKESLENGHYLGFESNKSLDAPPGKVDQVIGDGQQVRVGGVVLTANLTPGHTRGCTSWTMPLVEAGRTHKVVFFCSATVAGNTLAPKEQYPGIVADYRKTFARLKTIDADIYLAPHAEFFDMAGKRAKRAADPKAPSPYIVPGEFQTAVTKMAADFEVQLAQQQKAAAK